MNLLNTSILLAGFVGGNEKLLEGLASGENESNWDFIASLVEDGRIKNSEAIDALSLGLGILYNQYNEWSKDPHNLQDYWAERANEAKLALRQIFDKNQQRVSYRGFSLDKKDYSTKHLIN